MGMYTDDVQRLYVAYFNRPADPVSLKAYEDILSDMLGGEPATQADLEMLAETYFSPSQEYADLYAGQSNADIVNSLYNNLFNRDAEPAGLLDWTAKLNAGEETFASIALQLTYSAQGTDADTVAVKLASATLYTSEVTTTEEILAYQGNAAAASARSWLKQYDYVSGAATEAEAAQGVSDLADAEAEVSGQTYTLTVGVDEVPGTSGNDTINGLVDAVANGGTFGNADVIDGGAGLDTMNLTVLDVAALPAAALVNGVEVLNVRNLDDATPISLAGFVGLQQAWSKGSIDNTAYKNASTATTFGLVGSTDITVDFASTGGKADTASVALAGVGSAAAASTINVADGNSIEAVTVATSGTNYATIVAGTGAATITVTGDGTNSLDVTSAAATLTLDASEATGDNSFELGSVLTTTDVIMGGAGDDTVTAVLTSATLLKPEISGIETLDLTFDAAAVLNMAETTGATSVELAANESVSLTNVEEGLSTVNLTAGVDAVSIAYVAGAAAGTTVNVGSDALVPVDLTLGALTVANQEGGLTINAVGAKDNTIGPVDALKATALDVNVGAKGEINTGYITLGAVTSVDIDVAAAGVANVDDVEGSTIGSVSLDVGVGGSGEASAYASAGDMGDVILTVDGGSGYLDVEAYIAGTKQADIGNLTLNVVDGSGYLEADASSGSVGDVTVTATGEEVSAYISAYASAGTDAGGYQTLGGDIGDTTIDVTGESAYVSAYIDSSGGAVGDFDMSVTGKNSSAYAYIFTYATSGTASGAAENADIGNITFSHDSLGDSGYAYFSASAYGGDVGAVDFDLAGVSGSGSLYVSASDWSGAGASAGGSGNVGDISVDVAADYHSAYVDINADGDIGNASLTVGNDVDDFFYYASGNGDIGTVTASIGENVSAAIESDIKAAGATMGAINITAASGADVSAYAYASGAGAANNTSTITVDATDSFEIHIDAFALEGAVGDITVTGTSENVYVEARGDTTIGDIEVATAGSAYIYLSGEDTTLAGSITLTGGTTSEIATITVDAAAGSGLASVAGVDATAYVGALTVNLSDVLVTGTSIETGKGGDIITGTAQADNIFAGGGNDTINAGGGSDTIELGAGADEYNAGALDDVGVDVLLDFTSADSIDFGAVAAYNDDTATDYSAAADFAAAAALAFEDGDATAFTYGGKTYLVIDAAAGAGFSAATDAVIEITGTDTTTLTDANFI